MTLGVLIQYVYAYTCTRAPKFTQFGAGGGAADCVRHVFGRGGRERAATSRGVAGPPAADGGCDGDVSRGELFVCASACLVGPAGKGGKYSKQLSGGAKSHSSVFFF